MSFLFKLVYRDFLRHRSMLGFALTAIMATCGLIVWYVASIDMSSFAEDNGTACYFGTYSLAFCAKERVTAPIIAAVENSKLVLRTAKASQQKAKVRLAGFEQAMKPSGMGDRRDPYLVAIQDHEAPFEIEDGRWIRNSMECVVGTAAETLLVAVPGEESSRRIAVGDVLNVTTSRGTFPFTVSGLLKQHVPKDIRGRSEGMFSFGFGIGIGGGAMPNGPSAAVGEKSSGQGAGAAGDSLRLGRGQHEKGNRAAAGLDGNASGRQRGATGRLGRRANGRMREAPTGPTAPAVYLFKEDLERILGYEPAVNMLFVQLATPGTEAELYHEVEASCGSFEQAGVSVSDTRKLVVETTAGVSRERLAGQAWSTIGVVIIASVFIVFTTLSMGVSEKIRHLAMLRAVGFTRGQIAAVILLEGGILGLLGWLGGMAAGWALLTVGVWIENGIFPVVTLPWASVLFSLCCSLAGSLTASAVPAWRASKVSAAESGQYRLHSIKRGRLLLSGMLGILLLALIPVIVFCPHLDNRVRLILFSTVGTLLLGMGFLLFIPWTIVFTETIFRPPLAVLFGFHPVFLAKNLTGNFWRTLGTTLALSIGLALFTAIHVWGSSMLTMFRVPCTIPDVLVRFQEGIADPLLVEKVQKMPGIIPGRILRVSVAQPELSPELGTTLKDRANAMATNVVCMGIDGHLAFRGEDPLVRLRFVEGTREEVLAAFSEASDPRVCVIPETLAVHAGLHVGDSLVLEKRARRKRSGVLEQTLEASAEFVSYRIAGIVDFPWVWLSKCSGVRVSAGRTAALIFTPYAPLLRDFGALDGEFFWFDKEHGVTYDGMVAYMRRIAAEAAEANPRASGRESYAGGTLWDSGINRNHVMVSSNESLNNSLESRSGAVLSSMADMPLIILCLATLAVVNTMVVSVRARQWDFGVLRANGMTRGELTRLIVAESLMIGACACVMSFSFGVFYAWLANSMVDFAPVFGVIAPPLVIPWKTIAKGYGLACLFTFAAGVVPAVWAGRREIALLLRRRD